MRRPLRKAAPADVTTANAAPAETVRPYLGNAAAPDEGRHRDPAEKPAGAALIGLRWAAALFTLVAGIAAGVDVTRLADAGEPWSVWRAELRTQGLVILTISWIWLLLGTLLQAPLAARRGVRLRPGLLVTAGLLAWHVLITALAVPLADFAPVRVPGVGRGNPGSLYGTVLVSLLWPMALFTLAGGWFTTSDRTKSPADRPRRDMRTGQYEETAPERPKVSFLSLLVNIMALVSLAPGWVFFSWILVEVADRYELPLIPPAGMPVLAVGVALAVPSILIPLLRRRFVAVLIWNHVSPHHLAWGAPAVLLAAVLLAQAARVMNGGILQLIVILGLPTLYVRALQYLHARHPGRDAFE